MDDRHMSGRETFTLRVRIARILRAIFRVACVGHNLGVIVDNGGLRSWKVSARTGDIRPLAHELFRDLFDMQFLEQF